MDACLSEEETEDTGTSAKGKFSSNVTAAIIGYLIAIPVILLITKDFPIPSQNFTNPLLFFSEYYDSDYPNRCHEG